jgi:hypothetical protein
VFLVDWESLSGETSPFLGPVEVERQVIGPLSAACPAFRPFWSNSARSVSTADGTTTSYGAASRAFDFVHDRVRDGDFGDLHSALGVVDGFLDLSTASLRPAFELCFLDRLGELSLGTLGLIRERLGPLALAYWDRWLRYGSIRVGVLRDERFVETRRFARGDGMRVELRLPLPEAGATLVEVVRHDAQVVAERSNLVDVDGWYEGSWTWTSDDPTGPYELEIRLRDESLKVVGVVLEA